MENFEATSYQVGIKGVIVNPKKNKVLALLKNQENPFWDVPGGRTRDGETIEQTLERELREEILNLGGYKIIKILNASKIERAGLLLIFYKVEADIENVELSEEHKSYKWVSFEEIDSLEEEAEMGEGIREALKLSLYDK